MDVVEFRASVAQAEPPAGLSLALQTLWWDAKGYDRPYPKPHRGR